MKSRESAGLPHKRKIKTLTNQGDGARDPAADDEHGRLVPMGQCWPEDGFAADGSPQGAKKACDRKKPGERLSETNLRHEGERNQDCETNAESDQDWRGVACDVSGIVCDWSSH